MNNLTVQQVFARFYPDYVQKYMPSPDQAKAARNIMSCKTGKLGLNATVCNNCGAVQVHYNSCRSRFCPMCQALQKELWVDARKEDILDAPYFHMVFTVPKQLNSLIYSNQRILYDALYKAASETIMCLSRDKKHLGADVGFICVLHTWGSKMNYHPHIHTILLGGGLTPAQQWKDRGRKFFLPVKVVSKMFRGKYLARLKDFWTSGQLKFYGSAADYSDNSMFQRLINECYQTEWVTYCKEPFNGADSVISYLGKYTHRIAISNRRLISMDNTSVTYSVKDYKHSGKWKPYKITGIEFIRRFLMHVLPPRFVRLRHYGILCNRSKASKIALCRRLLNCRKRNSLLHGKTTEELMKMIYNVDIHVCKICGCRMQPFYEYPLLC